MGEFVNLEVKDGVGTIRLDRPKMNVINAELQEDLRSAATEAASDTDVRAIVLWGGPKVFAAGADITEMAEKSYAEMRPGALSAAFTLVADIPKPVIAAVNGYALGGGIELALCADMRIGGVSAKIGHPEILLGVIPGAGGTQRLTRLVGPAKSKDLCYTGRTVGSEEARSMGIFDRVVADDEVYDEAWRLAAELARGPAVAMAATKEAIDRGLETDLHTGLAIETQLFSALFATEDQKIGMKAFIESGRPGGASFVNR